MTAGQWRDQLCGAPRYYIQHLAADKDTVPVKIRWCGTTWSVAWVTVLVLVRLARDTILAAKIPKKKNLDLNHTSKSTVRRTARRCFLVFFTENAGICRRFYHVKTHVSAAL